MCRHVFSIAERQLGRNVDCPACGVRITAVPLSSMSSGSQDSSGPNRSELPLELLLDNVRSLWNVGSMFRSADGAGVRHIHLCGITGSPPRKEITKTALGADELIAWSHAPDSVARARELAAAGINLIALETTSKSVDYRAPSLPDLTPSTPRGPVCLIVGNEIAGISDAVLELAPVHLSLPMRGHKASLNVAVAAGIALYELASLVSREPV